MALINHDHLVYMKQINDLEESVSSGVDVILRVAINKRWHLYLTP